MTEKNQYSIAVLLPTRGRTDALSRSVIGLVNRAVMLDQVHLMFAFDNDDEIGKAHFAENLQPWLDNKGVDYTAMEFEPLGYGRLNEYINALAREANADWLFFWNDDAIMDSSGWDKVIASHTGEFKLLAVHTHKDHPYSIFPIVPKEWLDTLGYLSPHPLTDAWLSQVAYKLDIWERIPVHVTHDRHDLTGNNEDETFKARNMNLLEGNPTNPQDFHNPQWISLRIQETEFLSQYMKSKGLDTSWWENIKAGKQDPWEKLKANDVNDHMKQFTLKFKN
jgi:hypothetical protein